MVVYKCDLPTNYTLLLLIVTFSLPQPRARRPLRLGPVAGGTARADALARRGRGAARALPAGARGVRAQVPQGDPAARAHCE